MRPPPAAAPRWILLAAAVLFLWNVWGYDLWAPDEPYFGEGAREMVADGQWLVPHVNGVVTTDKPPLFFWLIAVLSLPVGTVISLTARLPSALAALGTLALTMRLGRRMFDPATGALAGVALATNYLVWDKARTAQIDSLLCLLILVAVSAFEAWRAGDARGRPAGVLFWAASGLAVLAKGPVGMLLPLGVALVTLAVDRKLGRWREFAPLVGPVAFAVVAGAWVVPAIVAGPPEYSLVGALREHFVERAMHGMHHAQPWWYYAQVLPVQLLPWSAVVPGAVLLAARRRTPADRLLLVWVVFVVLFFSVSTEKRDLYVLPAYPAFALLIGRLLRACAPDREGSSPGRRWVTVPLGLTAVVFVAVGLGLPLAARKIELVPVWAAAVTGAAVLAGGVATVVAAWRGRPLTAAGATAAGMAAAYLLTASFILPALDPVKSARAFSLRIRNATAAARAAGADVPAWRLGNLPEAFSFYTRGVYFPEISSVADLERQLDRPERAWAVVDADGLDELPPELRRRLVEVDQTRLSRTRVALVTNAAPAEPPPGTP